MFVFRCSEHCIIEGLVVRPVRGRVHGETRKWIKNKSWHFLEERPNELAKSLQISDESGFQYKNCWGHWRHQGNKPSVVEEVIDLLTICRRDEAGNHCPASWITLRPPLQTLAREGNISTCSREVVGLTRAEADRFLHFECAVALVQDAEEINLEQKGINWSAILALPAPEMDATT